MTPEPLGQAPTEALLPIHAAGLISESMTGQMIDGTTETILAVGLAVTTPGGAERHLMALAPVEIAAAVIAALREHARRHGCLDALTAATDRHEMMWRNTP